MIEYLDPRRTTYEYSGETQQLCAWCGNPIEEDDPVVIIPFRYKADETKVVVADDWFADIYHEGTCYEESEVDQPVIVIQRGFNCVRCGDTIYSNSRHDFVSCSCGAHFIDGGFDYIRTGGLPYIPVEDVSRQVNRALLKPYYYDEVEQQPRWTREQCMEWNRDHWEDVGEAVEARLAWWADAVNLPGKPYGDGDIDV